MSLEQQPTDLGVIVQQQQSADNTGTGVAGGQSAAPAQAGQSEPVFEIDGQQYTLAEIKRWRDTRPNLEKYYYTRLNDVAQREQQAQGALALYDYLRQRPDVAQRLADVIEGGGELPTQKQGETDDEYMTRLTRIEQQLQGVSARFQEQESRRAQEDADRMLSMELFKLREKYGADKILPFSDEQVLLEAHNSGIMDLERVYKQLRHDAIDVEKLKQQAVNEYVNSKKSAQMPRIPAGAGGGIPAYGGQPPKTLTEARRSAMQRLLGRREGE